jgi:hypothetical protein
MHTEPLATMQSINFFHVVVTLSLFLVNVMFTYVISHDGLPARLCHVGHEMVYMSAAIVVSHLFTAPASSRVVPIIAMFPYLALWAVTLVLTKRVIELGRLHLHPLTGVTLLLGALALFAALSGLVEAELHRFIGFAPVGVP